VEDWILSWKAVRGNAETLPEAIGLLWYRLRGVDLTLLQPNDIRRPECA
jgi:hypothetical protein